MKITDFQLTRQQYFYTAATLIVLCFSAMLINLGAHNMFVHTDEPRRAVVAMEMIFSGNYIVPTLNGEPYLNKPPLLNWLTVSSYALLNSHNEFAHRLPTLVTLFGLCLIIFFANRTAVNTTTALVVVLAMLTNAPRILFYDSFIGMIDIPFAMIVYAMFMAVYFFGQARNYRGLFLATYFLTALAFLTKALPALVFCGFTLLTYFIFFDNWRRLLSLDHALGVLLLGGMLGIYYGFYLYSSGIDPQTLLHTIIFESSKRTVLRFGVVDTLIHIVTFPFNCLENFAPWSFLGLLLFNTQIRKTLWQDRFIRYNILVLIANLLVYWSSPEVHPRYLFMHAPLYFTVAVRASLLAAETGTRWINAMNTSLITLSVVFVFALLFIAFYLVSKPQFHLDSIAGPLIFAAAASVPLALMVWMKSHDIKLLAMAAILIIGRFDYSIYMLPYRAHTQEPLKQKAIEIAQETRGTPLFLYESNSVQDGTTYYIERERGDVLRRRTPEADDAPAYYLVSGALLEKNRWKALEQMPTLFHKDLFLVKLPGATVNALGLAP